MSVSLDDKLLEAATDAVGERLERGHATETDICSLAISTYLSAATPADVADLVERLENRATTMNGAAVGAGDGATYALGYYDQFAAADDREAATTLLSLSARCGELERASEPFAKAADNFDNVKIENAEEWFAYPGVTSATENRGAISVGDLRRARAALSRRATGGENNG